MNRPISTCQRFIRAAVALGVLAACSGNSEVQEQTDSGLQSATDATSGQGTSDASVLRPPTLVLNATGANSHLSGIGRLDSSGACTAFWIDTPGGDEAAAYGVTAGHCVLEWARGSNATPTFYDVVHTASLSLNHFADAKGQGVQVEIASLAFATLHETDLAVLRFKASKSELRAQGLVPVEIARDIPERNAPVSIVGVPATDTAEEERYIHSVSCAAGPQRDIAEHLWIWNNVASNDCLGIRGGFSGSPVFDSEGAAFAITGSTSTGAISSTCYLGNPCEITSAGTHLQRDTNYGAVIVGIAECFDVRGQFVRGQEGCPLDDGDRLTATRVAITPANPTRDNVWNIELDTSWQQVRAKFGPIGTTDCRVEAGYSAGLPVVEQPLRELAMPGAMGTSIPEGALVHCLIGARLDGDALVWQSLQHPTRVFAYLDATPPIRTPSIVQQSRSDEVVWVTPVFEVPELAAFYYYLSSDATCPPDIGQYAPYRRVPISVMVSGDDSQTLCLAGADLADNRQSPTAFTIVNER